MVTYNERKIPVNVKVAKSRVKVVVTKNRLKIVFPNDKSKPSVANYIKELMVNT